MSQRSHLPKFQNTVTMINMMNIRTVIRLLKYAFSLKSQSATGTIHERTLKWSPKEHTIYAVHTAQNLTVM